MPKCLPEGRSLTSAESPIFAHLQHRLFSRVRLLEADGIYAHHPANQTEPAIFEAQVPAGLPLAAVLPSSLAQAISASLAAGLATDGYQASFVSKEGFPWSLSWSLEPAFEGRFWLLTQGLTPFPLEAIGSVTAAMDGKSSQHPALILGLDGHIFWTTPSFAELTGWEPVHIRGKPLHTLLDDPRNEEALLYLTECLHRGQPLDIAVVLRRTPGRFWHAELALRPLRHPNGQPWAFLVRLTDRTLEFRLGQHIEQQGRWINTLLQHVNLFIFLARREPWEPVYITPFGKQMTALDFDDPSAFWSQFLSRLQKTDCPSLVQQSVHSGQPVDFNWLHPDGSTRHYQLSAHCIIGDSSETWITGSITDVTEEREATRKALEKEREESLALIAGGLAHDFNNYLGAIQLGLNRLADQIPSEQPTLQLIQRQTDAARHLAAQLLRLSRQPQPLQVRSLVLDRYLRESVEMALAGSSIKVTTTLETSELRAYADPDALSQILLNLLLNAREAISGQGRIQITAETLWNDQGTPFIRIAIADSGPGISPAIENRLFEPFSTTKPTGTGLGLFTCRRIAREMSGDVSLLQNHHESLGGAVFALDLPLDSSNLTPNITENAGSPSAERPASQPSPSLTPHHIALLEDNEAISRLLTQSLQAMGQRVSAFASGHDLQAWLRQSPNDPPSAFILDLTLPDGLGGRQLWPELRRRFPTAPILLTSGYADITQLNFTELQTDRIHFLSKPFSEEKIREWLSTAFTAEFSI
ncbi:MAG: hypothetical protein OHK005_12920 [Candidatus Methylacidiphilales bacterium]